MSTPPTPTKTRMHENVATACGRTGIVSWDGKIRWVEQASFNNPAELSKLRLEETRKS
jgi:hypothetical protein